MEIRRGLPLPLTKNVGLVAPSSVYCVGVCPGSTLAAPSRLALRLYSGVAALVLVADDTGQFVVQLSEYLIGNK